MNQSYLNLLNALVWKMIAQMKKKIKKIKDTAFCLGKGVHH